MATSKVNQQVQSFCNEFKTGFQKFAKTAGYIASDMGTFNTTMKITKDLTKIAIPILEAIPAANPLIGPTRETGNIVGFGTSAVKALKFVDGIRAWVDPKERNQFINNWKKTAFHVCLSAGLLTEPLTFLEANKVISMGPVTSTKVGNFPVFKTAVDLTYFTAFGFELWSNIEDLQNLKEQGASNQQMLAKWRDPSFESKAYYEEKLNNLRATVPELTALHEKRDRLEPEERAHVEKVVAELPEKAAIYEARVNDPNPEAFKAHKVERLEVRQENLNRKTEKKWMSIACDIGKMVCIGLGIAGIAFFALGMPIWYTMAITAVSLATNSIDLAKKLYDEVKGPDKPEPVFVAA